MWEGAIRSIKAAEAGIGTRGHRSLDLPMSCSMSSHGRYRQLSYLCDHSRAIVLVSCVNLCILCLHRGSDKARCCCCPSSNVVRRAIRPIERVVWLSLWCINDTIPGAIGRQVGMLGSNSRAQIAVRVRTKWLGKTILSLAVRRRSIACYEVGWKVHALCCGIKTVSTGDRCIQQ